MTNKASTIFQLSVFVNPLVSCVLTLKKAPWQKKKVNYSAYSVHFGQTYKYMKKGLYSGGTTTRSYVTDKLFFRAIKR